VTVQVTGLALADTFSLDRNSRVMNAVTVPRDQGVPRLKLFALGQAPVSTGFRQPMKRWDIAGAQLQAIGHQPCPVFVIGTCDGFQIQQAASNGGVFYFAGGFIFKFVQAAFTAAVTERFPLILIHLTQGFTLPEGLALFRAGQGILAKLRQGSRVRPRGQSV